MCILFGLVLQVSGTVKGACFFQSSLSSFSRHAGQVAVDIVSTADGKVLFENNAEKPLVPASLVKILTTHAALKSLGPHHRFETVLYVDRSIQGNILPGDLWIRSKGDIFLTGEKAWKMAHRLRAAGIERIEGDIVVDNHHFDPSMEHICIDERCSRPYNPVISGTALDFNTITFSVVPGAMAGEPGRVTWFPRSEYVLLKNQSRTVGGRPEQNLHLFSGGAKEDGREGFVLAGEISLSSGEPLEFTLNIQNPWAFFGHSFKRTLKETGVRVQGGVRPGKVPSRALPLVVHESEPLGDLLFGLNRFSNNFMAEMLLRALGAKVYGEPGTKQKGIRVVEGHLRSMGISPSGFSIDSGSGLSRLCGVSARAFSRILVDFHHDFDHGPKFMASLAMNGHTGTLRRRLRESPVTLRGKTGSLRDVVAFSGYVHAPGEEILAVTVLLNDVKNSREAREVLYRFLEQLPSNLKELPRGGVSLKNASIDLPS